MSRVKITWFPPCLYLRVPARQLTLKNKIVAQPKSCQTFLVRTRKSLLVANFRIRPNALIHIIMHSYVYTFLYWSSPRILDTKECEAYTKVQETLGKSHLIKAKLSRLNALLTAPQSCCLHFWYVSKLINSVLLSI